MSFVIDSSEWNFNGLDAQSVTLKLEQLLERVSVANERGEDIYIGADLQSQPVCDDMDLWSYLFHDSMEILDRGIIDELSAFLNSANFYEDVPAIWPKGFTDEVVLDENGVQLNLDIAFAHFNVLSQKPFACITLNNTQSLKTISSLGTIEIQLINNEDSHKNFWRITALNILRDTAKNLEFLSPHSYPNLLFLDGVWDGVKNFEGGYARVNKALQKYLAGLDDFGCWMFTTPPPATHPSDTIRAQEGTLPTNELIERRFGGIGLEIAPEKPDVYKDKKCREAREVPFMLPDPAPSSGQQVKLYCEWHCKFEKHTNRVHIHPPTQGSNGKVIIAIYHKHLPLPNK